MECPVPMKCDDGYWLHDFLGRLSCLDGDCFVYLVDLGVEKNDFGMGM